MKSKQVHRSRTLSYFLAGVGFVFVTGGAWAAKTWTGNGADSNWSTTGNWGGNGGGHIWFNSNISGTWNRLATISAATEETLSTMWVHVGSEDDPFVFQNNASLKIPNTTYIGSKDGNGGAIFRGGIFNGKDLYLADTNKTAYLCLDRTTLNLSGTANLNNGKFVCEGSTLTVKDMNAGNVTNGVVTIEKNSGDWTFSGNPKFGTATGSVVRVSHRGGSIKSGYMDVGVDNVPADVEFEISGGVITNTLYATINSNSKMTVKGPGRLISTREKDTDDYLIGLYIKNGTLNITDGGEVSVPYSGAHLTRASGETATVNISNGGILSAKRIYNKDNGNATINVDGGIIRACADHAEFINAKSKFNIYISSNGGTIDTAGHSVTIGEDLKNASGQAGFVRFTGGGTATLTGNASYSGATVVTPGTKLVVSQNAAKDNILNNGLVIAGVPGVGDEIFVVTRGPDYTISADQLAKVTCPLAPDTTFALGDGNTNIVVQSVGSLAPAYWTGAAGDNNLSTSGNWSGGVVPTRGNPVILCPTSTTLTVGGTFRADTITIPDYSAVVTLADALTVNCLTNASRLAVASTGSLTVTGDLVATVDVVGGTRAFLYSNEGTVTVGGKAIGYSNVDSAIVYEYAAVTENTRPIQAHGIAYQCGGSGQLYMKLQTSVDTAGSWVVGSDGMSLSGRNANYTTFWAQYAAVTLYSAADWTLANSKKYNTVRGDLYVPDNSGSSLAIDTSDYATPATPRTVTLKGRIVAYNPVTIKGCGTVVVDTTGSSTAVAEDLQHTCITNATTLSVTDTATLQINSGKKITGNGTISLAAGTTLALPAASRDENFSMRIAPSVTLPESGTATLKIDGTRLHSGIPHVILNSVPTGYADHLTVTGTAIDGRQTTLSDDGENLILTIQSRGLTVILK